MPYYRRTMKWKLWPLSAGQRPFREWMTEARGGLGKKGAPNRLHPFFYGVHIDHSRGDGETVEASLAKNIAASH